MIKHQKNDGHQSVAQYDETQPCKRTAANDAGSIVRSRFRQKIANMSFLPEKNPFLSHMSFLFIYF